MRSESSIRKFLASAITAMALLLIIGIMPVSRAGSKTSHNETSANAANPHSGDPQTEPRALELLADNFEFGQFRETPRLTTQAMSRENTVCTICVQVSRVESYKPNALAAIHSYCAGIEVAL